MADVVLPDLPSENDDPWFEARAAFDTAVRQQLEGPLSESSLSKTFGPLRLTVATVTSAATLAADKHTPVDATAAALTVTLPTPTRAGQVVVVEKVDATANAVTVSGTIRGVTATTTLVGQYETLMLISESTTSWRPEASHRTKTWLDSTIAAQAVPKAFAGSVNARVADTTIPALGAAVLGYKGGSGSRFPTITLGDGVTQTMNLVDPWDVERRRREADNSRSHIVQAVALPSGFTGWSAPAGYVTLFDGKRYFTTYDVAVKKNVGNVYYVDTKNGVDTNSGAQATPWKTVDHAYGQVADGDTITIVDTGLIYRASFANSNPVRSKSINIIGQGTTTIVAGDNLAYTKTSGMTNTWQAARTSVVKVVDLLVDPAGYEYTAQTSIAAVDANPGSWYSDGTNVYFSPIDGNTAPTSARFVALLGINVLDFATTGRTSDLSVYLEGMRVICGANAMNVTGDATYAANIYAKNCQVSHGTNASQNAINCVDVGHAIFQNVTVAYGLFDGFNYHQTNRVTSALEIGCEAHSCGLKQGTAYQQNGSTFHDGIKGVRLGGNYHHTNGAVVADVEVGTQSVNYGCDSYDSVADPTNGANAAFSSQQAGAEMWLFGCRAWGCSFDITAVTGATIHVDDLTQYDSWGGTGTIDIVSAG